MFVQSPIFEKADVLAAKRPRVENNPTIGSLVRFKARSGKEADWERYLKEALIAIQEAPGTTSWFAFRLDASTFGVFDTFSDEEGRQAHFLAGAGRTEKASALLEIPPVVEKIDVFAARLSE